MPISENAFKFSPEDSEKQNAANEILPLLAAEKIKPYGKYDAIHMGLNFAVGFLLGLSPGYAMADVVVGIGGSSARSHNYVYGMLPIAFATGLANALSDTNPLYQAIQKSNPRFHQVKTIFSNVMTHSNEILERAGLSVLLANLGYDYFAGLSHHNQSESTHESNLLAEHIIQAVSIATVLALLARQIAAVRRRTHVERFIAQNPDLEDTSTLQLNRTDKLLSMFESLFTKPLDIAEALYLLVEVIKSFDIGDSTSDNDKVNQYLTGQFASVTAAFSLMLLLNLATELSNRYDESGVWFNRKEKSHRIQNASTQTFIGGLFTFHILMTMAAAFSPSVLEGKAEYAIVPLIGLTAVFAGLWRLKNILSSDSTLVHAQTTEQIAVNARKILKTRELGAVSNEFDLEKGQRSSQPASQSERVEVAAPKKKRKRWKKSIIEEVKAPEDKLQVEVPAEKNPANPTCDGITFGYVEKPKEKEPQEQAPLVVKGESQSIIGDDEPPPIEDHDVENPAPLAEIPVEASSKRDTSFDENLSESHTQFTNFSEQSQEENFSSSAKLIAKQGFLKSSKTSSSESNVEDTEENTPKTPRS